MEELLFMDTLDVRDGCIRRVSIQLALHVG